MKTPPTHPGGAYGKAGPEVVMTSEATAGPQTASEVIWYRSYLKYEQMSAMTP